MIQNLFHLDGLRWALDRLLDVTLPNIGVVGPIFNMYLWIMFENFH